MFPWSVHETTLTPTLLNLMLENKLITASKLLNFSIESYQILLLEGTLGILVPTLYCKNDFNSQGNEIVGGAHFHMNSFPRKLRNGLSSMRKGYDTDTFFIFFWFFTFVQVSCINRGEKSASFCSSYPFIIQSTRLDVFTNENVFTSCSVTHISSIN